MDHVKGYVEQDVVMVDGVPCTISSYSRTGYTKLREGELYVCPNSGLLKKAKKPHEKITPRMQVKRIDQSFVAIQLEGVWYEATMKYVSFLNMHADDIVLGSIHTARLEETYGKVRGRYQYAVSLRPMKLKEVKRLI
jgi:hypothetical protein